MKAKCCKARCHSISQASFTLVGVLGTPAIVKAPGRKGRMSPLWQVGLTKVRCQQSRLDRMAESYVFIGCRTSLGGHWCDPGFKPPQEGAEGRGHPMSLGESEVGGMPWVALACLDPGWNSNGEGSLLGFTDAQRRRAG